MSENKELSDADLEEITCGMGKVAAYAVVNEMRPRTPFLRAALVPVRVLTPRAASGSSCSGGVCNV